MNPLYLNKPVHCSPDPATGIVLAAVRRIAINNERKRNTVSVRKIKVLLKGQYRPCQELFICGKRYHGEYGDAPARPFLCRLSPLLGCRVRVGILLENEKRNKQRYVAENVLKRSAKRQKMYRFVTIARQNHKTTLLLLAGNKKLHFHNGPCIMWYRWAKRLYISGFFGNS